MGNIPIPGHKPVFTSKQEDDEGGDDLFCAGVEEAMSPVDPTPPVVEDDGSDDEFIRHLREAEKSVNHMYRDSEGYPTVGIGHLLEKPERAVRLPFKYGDPDQKEEGSRDATPDEIHRAYDTLPRPSGKNNFGAEWYNPKTRPYIMPLYLTDQSMEDIFAKDVIEKKRSIADKFPDYPTYPKGAQNALLDMEFNMGGKFTKNKWPKFFEAVQNKDWSRAAHESHRYQVDDRRNKKTFDWLFDAWREDRRQKEQGGE